jgi:hypothetical protein
VAAVTVGELLWKRVTARDFDSLVVDLGTLSSDERTEAQAWYRDQWKRVRHYYAAGTDFVRDSRRGVQTVDVARSGGWEW